MDEPLGAGLSFYPRDVPLPIALSIEVLTIDPIGTQSNHNSPPSAHTPTRAGTKRSPSRWSTYAETKPESSSAHSLRRQALCDWNVSSASCTGTTTNATSSAHQIWQRETAGSHGRRTLRHLRMICRRTSTTAFAPRTDAPARTVSYPRRRSTPTANQTGTLRTAAATAIASGPSSPASRDAATVVGASTANAAQAARACPSRHSRRHA